MEWKIGEIFEYNGGWYQCIVGNSCENCAFNGRKCYTFTENNDPIGDCCADRRKDNKDVIFKKLEKVGEPYMNNEKIVQKYKIYYDPLIAKNGVVERYVPGLIDIVIKQNKEEMEEKKLNLKPFDLEAAKQGKPVCTRDGRRARIICFDKEKDIYPLIVLVSDKSGYEIINQYKANGAHPTIPDNDLMMLYEKKEGWVNVYRSQIYNTLEKAKEASKITCNYDNYLQTIKIEWEE